MSNWVAQEWQTFKLKIESLFSSHKAEVDALANRVTVLEARVNSLVEHKPE